MARRQRDDAAADRAQVEGDQAKDEPATPASEQALAEQRRRDRAEAQERRRLAQGANAELGAAVLKHLARLKVDDRVLKVLIAVDATGDLPGLAARGARYGFPGWVQTQTSQAGKTKTHYLTKEQAGAKAREFLSGAKNTAELAGRVFCLIAMARYADEDAVANSNRSFVSLRVGDGAPWSDDVIDLVDELCAERLPDHLTSTVREQRAAQREERDRRERERTEALGRLDGLEQRVGDLSAEERAQALSDAETAYGRYSTQMWHFRRLIEARDTNADTPDVDEPAETSGQPAERDADDTAALAA